MKIIAYSLLLFTLLLSSCYMTRLNRMKRADFSNSLCKKSFRKNPKATVEYNAIYYNGNFTQNKKTITLYRFFPNGKVYINCFPAKDSQHAFQFADTNNADGYITNYRIKRNKLVTTEIERLNGKRFKYTYTLKGDSILLSRHGKKFQKLKQVTETMRN